MFAHHEKELNKIKHMGQSHKRDARTHNSSKSSISQIENANWEVHWGICKNEVGEGITDLRKDDDDDDIILQLVISEVTVLTL